MDYQAYIKWLEEVPLYAQKDGIHNMEVLLERLDSPHKAAPVIHVAGTNGKGSCCAMLAQILRESGYKTGLYASPHLVEYTERIQVDGQQIPQEEWARIGMQVKSVIDSIVAEGGNHATFFEIITAIAFVYFAQQQVDVIVLETGVGGRLDATNAVENPLLCLITSISLDHTKVLGDTLPQIAAEKAGIIKPGRPIVLAENPAEVQQVVEQRARELGSDYYYSGHTQRQSGAAEMKVAEPRAAAADYQSELFHYENLQMSLIGDYQEQNLAAVLYGVHILQQQGWAITEQTLRRGLQHTHHPGRMEQRTYHGKPLLLDGAHNPGGAHMLVNYLAAHYAPGSCHLVFSALAKKDVSHILLPLRDCPAIGRVTFTCIEGENQMDTFGQLWQHGDPEGSRQAAKPFQCIAQPAKALEAAAASPETQRIIGAGSLYLVGELEAILQKEEQEERYV